MPYSRNLDVDAATTKIQASKNTRYIDKHLDEVYPTRKPTSRLIHLWTGIELDFFIQNYKLCPTEGYLIVLLLIMSFFSS